jgi:adenine phosphoribosyltransferase
MTFANWLRDIPDFPKPGVTFKDVTPLLGNGPAFAAAVDAMLEPFHAAGVTKVGAIEARGFIFGAAAAVRLGCGFFPLRKPGKLPAAKVGVDYALEYGTDRLEMHADAVLPGDRVLLVDDVLATGGTLCAAVELLQTAKANIVGAALLIELEFLRGRDRWSSSIPLHSVIRY